MNEQFSIVKEANGYAVKFPKILLQQFKDNFRGATWRNESKTWLIGSRSEKKFNLWAKEVESVLIESEKSETIETQEDIDNFLKNMIGDKLKIISDQIEKISNNWMLDDELQSKKDDLKHLENDMNRLKSSLEKRLVSKKLLLEKTNVIEKLNIERNSLKAQLNAELLEIKKLVDKAVDIVFVEEQHSILRKNFGKIGSAISHQFRTAQNKLKEQQDILHSIGLHSVGLSEMISMNMNRPDRDKLPPFDSIYDIKEYQDEED
jgi:hypothetical protein